MMYLSIICFKFLWLIFLLIMGHVFLLLCMPGNLFWVPDIVNFDLFGDARYFCVSINILELCPGTQLNYLEIV